MNTAANLNNIQTQRKSILDMTDLELAQIDNYQNANRGFIDNDEPELENSYFNVDRFQKANEAINDRCLSGSCQLSNTLIRRA